MQRKNYEKGVYNLNKILQNLNCSSLLLKISWVIFLEIFILLTLN